MFGDTYNWYILEVVAGENKVKRSLGIKSYPALRRFALGSAVAVDSIRHLHR